MRRLVPLGRVAALSMLLASRLAHADGAVPPRVVHVEDAADPRPEGPRVVVPLVIVIDASGHVTSVEPVSPPDAALAPLVDAAVAAARAMTFEPARRGDVPVAAKIRYDWVFAERVAEPEPPPAPADPAPAAPAEAEVPGASAPSSSSPAASDDEGYGASAAITAPPRAPTKQSFSGEELARMPGTRGDAIRATELLPGVGRPAAGDGQPVLRGANLEDSQVFAEGMPVPILYHFGGLASFAHSRVLESVDVYPSNFSVRYGRKAGGVIDVRFRDPRTDAPHLVLDLSLLESAALVEAPVTERLSVMASARRSNLDAVLSAVATDDFAIPAAPVYWDYQAIATFTPTDRDRLRIVAWGSRDSFRFLLKKPADVDPTVRGSIGATTAFHDVQLGYRHRFAGGSSLTAEATYGRSDGTVAFAALSDSKFGVDSLQGRSELTLVLAPAARLVAGVDLLANHFVGRYRGIPEPTEGAAPTALATQRSIAIAIDRWVLLPGAYAELGLRPTPTLLLLPGLRLDHDDLVNRSSLDPRFSTRWDVTERVALKGGAGRFTQQPQESRAVAPIGNPDLGLTHSTHLSAGVEHRPFEGITVSAEGFVKWLDGIVESTPDRVAPYYENSQRGRIFGGELFARVRATSRFFGFVSYTLMRSERRSPGEAWRLFERDTPHLVSAAASYKLGRGWEAGLAFRFTSGTPYTPVVASTYDAANDVYVPRAGASMSARNPPYVRLDARIEKKWTFTHWSLAWYLDVQNALNSPNREGFSYAYDYSSRSGTRGLPIFPALGLRGEL